MNTSVSRFNFARSHFSDTTVVDPAYELFFVFFSSAAHLSDTYNMLIHPLNAFVLCFCLWLAGISLLQMLTHPMAAFVSWFVSSPAISLLQMLIHPMNAFPWVINGIVEANVSKDRLEKLLLRTTGVLSEKESGGYDTGDER